MAESQNLSDRGGKTPKRKLIRRLRKHYRLVVMNDDNFEVKASVKLTPLNVLFISSTLLVLFTVVIVLLLRYTALRNVFFDYDRNYLTEQKLIEYKIRLDSVE